MDVWIIWGCVILVLVIGVAFVIYHRRHPPITLGYPPRLFPQQEIVRSTALQQLSSAQARLLAMHTQLPPRSDLAHWLGAFLHELRPAMDLAYQTICAQPEHDHSAIAGLLYEVTAIEHEVHQRIVQQLLSAESNHGPDGIDSHLHALRQHVHALRQAPLRAANPAPRG